MKLASRILRLQGCVTPADVSGIVPIVSNGLCPVAAYLMASKECERVTVSGSGYASIIMRSGQWKRVDLGAAVEKFVMEC